MSHWQSSPPADQPAVTTIAIDRRIRAVFFDLMGTCLDWHSSVVSALPPTIPEETRSRLALDWRQEFFNELHARSRQELAPEPIDVTHRRTLLRILAEPQQRGLRPHFIESCNGNGTATVAAAAAGTGTEMEMETGDLPPDGEPTAWPAVEQAVASWHRMAAWPDVLPALTALKEKLGLEVFVLANGSTRLQLDLMRSSGLGASFDMLFSSELLGVYKPAPEAYESALALVMARPEQAVMVAAHAYDLRAAKALGMHTIYVYRWTDDTDEDMGIVRRENEHFLGEGGMQGLVNAIEALQE
ncbi:HAD-like protein [Xylariaceae sp. FL1651]|nr:HAD-like protein [Xylariaceae sp. FL1651]